MRVKLKMNDVVRCPCGTVMRVSDWNAHKCGNVAGVFFHATEDEIKALIEKEKQEKVK